MPAHLTIMINDKSNKNSRPDSIGLTRIEVPDEGLPPDLGCRRIGDDVDEVAARIYLTLQFWCKEENRGIYEAVRAIHGDSFEVILASSLAGTLSLHFEIRAKKPAGESDASWRFRKFKREVRFIFMAICDIIGIRREK